MSTKTGIVQGSTVPLVPHVQFHVSLLHKVSHSKDVALPAAAKQVVGVHRPGPGAGRSERLIDPAGSERRD